MASTFDVIVAGVGAMGAQTCWHLAKGGARVLGVDRFDIPNALGSSHGVNRIIRLAYFEHPLYVPLLRRAYEVWRDMQAQVGEQLLYVTGSLDAGPTGSDIIAGSLASCREHGLAHEHCDATTINTRFPGYRLPDGFEAVYQPDGGFVASERSIAAAATLAMTEGAVLRAHEPIVEFAPIAGGGIRVMTARGTYEAGRLVISSGAWVGELLPQLATLCVPERQVLGWFQPKRPEYFQVSTFPVSNVKSDLGHFYQFPVWSAPGFKIGLYHHLRERGTPETLSREVTIIDEDTLRSGIRRFFPDADGDLLALRTCMFTNVPDGHFIIDTLPALPEVIVASPCSGHGFKFSSVIGEILADMAIGRTPSFDLSPFALSRFG